MFRNGVRKEWPVEMGGGGLKYEQYRGGGGG